METKDIIIGVLIVALAGLAGGLGYVILSEEPTTLNLSPTLGGTTDTQESGLPDDWSTAPNSSYFTLTDQEGNSVNITLKEILDQVLIADNAEKYDFNTGIGLTSIYDQLTGIPLTGVYLTDVLDHFNISFPGEIEFISHNLEEGDPITEDIEGVDLMNKIEGYEEDVIIVLAANKEWLKDSVFSATWGNFSLSSEGRSLQLQNLEEISVNSNWTLQVYVDDVLNYTLQPSNFTSSLYAETYNYSYDRNDYWNYNREVIGINLSLLCEWAGFSDSDSFEVKAVSADDWAAPHGKPSKRGFNETEVFSGLAYNSTYWEIVNETGATPDGVPLPADVIDGKPIMLAYSQQLLGEINLGASEPYPTNPTWPEQQSMGLAHGPLTCIVPGATRDRFVKMIYRIDITT